MKSASKFLTKIFTLPLVLSALACGQAATQSHRQSIHNENEANVQAEMKDLEPAESDYQGDMHMVKSHQSFEVIVSIRRVFDNSRQSQSVDPTQTVPLPKLSGFMKFPALDQMQVSDYTNFSEIINPMGGFSTVLFDYGDYDPQTKMLILPYSVSGYEQGNFGELQGILQTENVYNDAEKKYENKMTFKGTWFAKPLGIVATFDLAQVSPHSSASIGTSSNADSSANGRE